MSLRSRLEKRGYVLVNQGRFRRNTILESRLRNSEESGWASRAYISELTDRIAELEAEVEAHKRIEAKLAERALERDTV